MSKYGDSKDVWDRTYGRGTEHEDGNHSLRSLSFGSAEFISAKEKEGGDIKLSSTLLLQRLVGKLCLCSRRENVAKRQRHGVGNVLPRPSSGA